MKTQIDPKVFATVCGALAASDAKTAVKFLSPKLVVRATWRHRPRLNHTREEMVLTFGVPNYLETRIIALCVAAGEVFPVRKVQFKPWPKARKARHV